MFANPNTNHGPATIDDPEFGLLYNDMPWMSESFSLRDSDPPAYLCLPGDESGPSQYSRELIHQLRIRYGQLTSEINRHLEQQSSCDDANTDTCPLEEISVGEDDDDFEIQLGFLLPDQQTTCYLDFTNWRVANASVEQHVKTFAPQINRKWWQFW